MSGLGVGPVSLLLDLVYLLGVTSRVLSLSEGHVGSALVVQLSAVEISILRIDVSADAECASLIALVVHFDGSSALLVVVLVECL